MTAIPMNQLDDALTASELLNALTRTVNEEAAGLREQIGDEDSDCLVRDLRAERLAALDWVLRVLRQAERWEW